jgi:hypothetical protein
VKKSESMSRTYTGFAKPPANQPVFVKTGQVWFNRFLKIGWFKFKK